VIVGKPYLKAGMDGQYVVSATINFSGIVTGSFCLRLSQKTALALASSLVGTEAKVFNADCLDAVGEIASIVSGNAKKSLAGKSINMTVPSLNVGPQKRVPSSDPTIIIPCETKVGPFAMEVTLSEPANSKT
jgi:CheY-specific phosphatase CheX